MTDDSGQTDDRLSRVLRGDEGALADLFSLHRDRLWRTVHFRLDRRLAGRVDPDDILQEAYLNAAARIGHFADDSPDSFFVWLRFIVGQTMVDVHRRHLGAQKRDAVREISLRGGTFPQATSTPTA